MLAFTLLMSGCKDFSFPSFDDDQVIASVGEKSLYRSDIQSLFVSGMTPEDSLNMVKSYVDQWVRKEVKIAEAEKLFAENQDDIKELMEYYRTSLLMYKFDKEFVSQHIDTLVTSDQVSEYYREHRDEFTLAGPIVKARVVRLPAKLRNQAKLEEMFRSKKEVDYQNFVDVCAKNDYKLDDFTAAWTEFSEVLKHIPFDQKNFDEFLKKSSFYETEDDAYKYMMVIEAYRPTGDYSPLEMESSVIRKIILNGRRGNLIKALEDSLYSKAVQMNEITINMEL